MVHLKSEVPVNIENGIDGRPIRQLQVAGRNHAFPIAGKFGLTETQHPIGMHCVVDHTVAENVGDITDKVANVFMSKRELHSIANPGGENKAIQTQSCPANTGLHFGNPALVHVHRKSVLHPKADVQLVQTVRRCNAQTLSIGKLGQVVERQGSGQPDRILGKKCCGHTHPHDQGQDTKHTAWQVHGREDKRMGIQSRRFLPFLYLRGMVRFRHFLLLFAGILLSCGENPAETALKVEAEPDPNSPAAMVRIPVDDAGRPDPSKLATLSFETNVYDFGTVKEGEIVEYEFRFTNTGKAALIIYDARSSCGCTVPEFPKDPIPPGDTSMLKVRFNTDGKTGKQVKTVTVQANTFPAESKLSVTGEVQPK